MWVVLTSQERMTTQVPAGTAPAGQIRTSITAPRVTPATNQQACELFVHVMIHTSRHGDVWNNLKVLATTSTRYAVIFPASFRSN